jgi:hypothetical protein
VHLGGYATHWLDAGQNPPATQRWVKTSATVPSEESVGWRYARLNGFAHRMLDWWLPIVWAGYPTGTATHAAMLEELDYVHRAYGGFDAQKNELLCVRLAMMLGKWGIDHARVLSIDWDPDMAIAALVGTVVMVLVDVVLRLATGDTLGTSDFDYEHGEWTEAAAAEIERKFAEDPYLTAVSLGGAVA